MQQARREELGIAADGFRDTTQQAEAAPSPNPAGFGSEGEAAKLKTPP